VKKWLGPVVAVILLFGAFWLLRLELSGLSWGEIRSDVGRLRWTTLAAGLSLTGLNYLILSGYDTLALRYVGVQVARSRVLLASTVGYAFSQGLGFPLLTGAPVRYRLYSSWGLSAADIGRVVAFYTASFWIGFAAVGSVVFFITPVEVPAGIGLPGGSLRAFGAALVVGLVGYVAWSLSRRGSLRIGSFRLSPPSPPLVAGQIVVGLLDWVVSCLVLWVMLPEGHGLGWAHFLSAFLLAQSVGIVSSVPGGLGVFEAVFLTFLPGRGAAPDVLASLVAYRAVYYLAPLFVAALALGIRELKDRVEPLGGPALQAARVASQLVPAASAALALTLGGVLLLSGSVPIPSGRLAALGTLLPPVVMEASHFLASLLGVSLIVLARGLQLRLDGAYHLALAVLLGAAVLGLSHDLHFVGSLVFVSTGWVLYASRREFYRRASLLDQTFTPSWILAIGSVMAVAIWLGLFAFQNVDYSADLWWRFALQEDAPRFLRATVGASVGLAVFVGMRLLRPAPRVEPAADSATLESIAPLVAAADDIGANLVLLGDKRVRRSPSGRSFLMFGVSGSSWIVMGDPIGDPSEFEGLVWSLHEEADRAGGDLVFYEVGPGRLPLYIDLGLVFYKLGERARVPLSDFSLEGKARGDLRQARGRLERAGGTFEVVSPAASSAIMPRLREISDEWLESKKVREKRFSLGRFDEDYVARFPIGLIRVEGVIVAFATLWTSTARVEVSPDLIRYADDAPKGVMDALFTHLLLWGHEEGYQWFNLGMAPFSGLDAHRLAPSWERLGSALFRYGEHFYNFQGLRAYKEKFSPVWEPRYLAAPPGLGVAGVMADVTGLVSGGLRGAVMR
jgi:phosphatidylglycerol lysyltransferase